MRLNNDNKLLKKFLQDVMKDMEDIVVHIDFFIEDDFRDLRPQFSANMKYFNNAIEKTIRAISSTEYQKGLEVHGLTGQELKRKLDIYYKIRNNYYKAKIAFAVSMLRLLDEAGGNVREKFSRVSYLPEKQRKSYKYSFRKLNIFRWGKEKIADIINLGLNSVSLVIDFAALASEFKGTVEIVTEKEKAPSLQKILMRLDDEMIEILKKDANSDL